ncbi:MAG: FeoB-associated Cys-rich membrane protein [Cellvibrio sp.]|nr:FeoB-associated Cys-rich membrane protein [Cellvibrio sp.]
MWQELIVGACVLMAAIFLIRHWFFNQRKNNCGGCSSCDKKPETKCHSTPH